MKNIREIFISGVFILILLFPAINSGFRILPEEENHENRAMKKLPVFDISFLDVFPKEYDEYFSDNFNLRENFLALNSKIKFHVFHKAPINTKAFLGIDGWMYSVFRAMENYLAQNLMNADEKQRFYDIIKYRKDFLDSLNCKYYFAIIPQKTTVYPEYLPLSKRIDIDERVADQICDIVDTMNGVTLIDLRPVLKSNKNGIRMFHKTDNHWNDYGCLVAYDTMLDVIAKDFPRVKPINMSSYVIDSVVTKGKNLAHIMGIYDGVTENKIICKPDFEPKAKKGIERGYPVVEGFPYLDEFEEVYTTGNDSLPKILVIRDSFGSYLLPMISENFSETIFIFDGWHHRLNKDIALNEKPDIFIQLVWEPLLPNIIRDAKYPPQRNSN